VGRLINILIAGAIAVLVYVFLAVTCAIFYLPTPWSFIIPMVATAVLLWRLTREAVHPWENE
jgi:hypothetical protein